MSASTPNTSEGTTLRKNTARQPTAPTNAPPTKGPAAAAIPITLVRTAMGMASRSDGNAARSMPSVAGWSSAPNTPWTTRSPITHPTPGASPIPAEARPKPSMPSPNIR